MTPGTRHYRHPHFETETGSEKLRSDGTRLADGRAGLQGRTPQGESAAGIPHVAAVLEGISQIRQLAWEGVPGSGPQPAGEKGGKKSTGLPTAKDNRLTPATGGRGRPVRCRLHLLPKESAGQREPGPTDPTRAGTSRRKAND